MTKRKALCSDRDSRLERLALVAPAMSCQLVASPLPVCRVIFGYLECCLRRPELRNLSNPLVCDFSDLQNCDDKFAGTFGGGEQIRTAVAAFAERCLATWLRHLIFLRGPLLQSANCPLGSSPSHLATPPFAKVLSESDSAAKLKNSAGVQAKYCLSASIGTTTRS